MVKEEGDCVEMRDNQSKVRPCDWHNGRNAVVLECSVGKTTLWRYPDVTQTEHDS